MENGIYWVWKDVARGKDPDNFITVTGTEFYDIMRSSHGRRHYIRLRGEQASETLYLEVTREDYERHAYIAENRYLTEAPVTIQEIAAHLHRSLTETHRRITRVQELLLEAMHEYNPPLYERYERRAAYC